MNDPSLELLQDRPLLHVKYTHRRAVPPLVQRRGGRVELFVPVPLDLDAGTPVRLRVAFGDSGKNFYVAGRAAPVRRGGDDSDAFFLLIDQRPDLRAFQHLWSFCTGLTHEQARRFAASIPCTVRTRTTTTQGKILDMSMSGAFVTVGDREPPPEGAEVELSVRTGFLRLLRRDLRAQLVWQGEKDGTPGFGAEFVDGARVALEVLRGRVLKAR